VDPDAGDVVRPSEARWRRHDWWGVVLDAPDVAVLARFYSELRRWAIWRQDDAGAALDPAGHPFSLYTG